MLVVLTKVICQCCLGHLQTMAHNERRVTIINKIQRVSQLFKWIFIIAFIVLPLLSIVFWLQAPAFLHFGSHAITYNEIPAEFSESPMAFKYSLSFTASTKFLGFSVSLIPLAIKLTILYLLIKLFKNFQQGDIFSMKSVSYVKAISITLLLGQLIHRFYQALLSLVLTWHNPVGKRVIVVGFSGTNFGMLCVALLMLLISWILRESYQLYEQQKYTI